MARVRARAVYLHGINTLYHAVSVYTGMHKTLETLETPALRARVSKPVSAVLYIPVYTSTAWYNLYVGSGAYTLVTVDKPQLPQCPQCLVDCKGLSQSHSSFMSNPVPVQAVVGDTHSVFRAVYSALN